MLPNTYFDDDMITCPDCDSPEKYEIESIHGDGFINYTYRCVDCGVVYVIKEMMED